MSRPVSIRGVNSCPSGPYQYGSNVRIDLDTSSNGPAGIGHLASVGQAASGLPVAGRPVPGPWARKGPP
jgi:hypothetical protein